MNTIHNALDVQPSVKLTLLTNKQCTHRVWVTTGHSSPSMTTSTVVVVVVFAFLLRQKKTGNEDKIRTGYLRGSSSLWKGQNGATQRVKVLRGRSVIKQPCFRLVQVAHWQQPLIRFRPRGDTAITWRKKMKSTKDSCRFMGWPGMRTILLMNISVKWVNFCINYVNEVNTN